MRHLPRLHARVVRALVEHLAELALALLLQLDSFLLRRRRRLLHLRRCLPDQALLSRSFGRVSHAQPLSCSKMWKR